jgi:hypothetical protein
LLEADMADTGKQLRREYATAVEAMQILGVRPQTLYAYASRGWLRSIAQKGLKGKLYLRKNLKRLGMRSLARSGHGPVGGIRDELGRADMSHLDHRDHAAALSRWAGLPGGWHRYRNSGPQARCSVPVRVLYGRLRTDSGRSCIDSRFKLESLRLGLYDGGVLVHNFRRQA